MTSDHNPSDAASLISLFPLPSSVFYPNTLLPLHIFEPRYREMVSDALEGNRKIGMVLLQPGWEADYYGAPAVSAVGCVGTIDQHVRFEDGKYNMVLKGENRFRIVEEVGGKPYRRAKIEILTERNDQNLNSAPNPIKDELIAHSTKYWRLLPPGKNLEKELDGDTLKTLGHLTDQLAFGLELTVEEKQKFLEELDVLRRVDLLHSALKIKMDLIHFSKVQMERGFDVNLN